MTITTTANRVAYTGDGSTTAFTVNYPFFLATDLLVYLIDTSGNTTLQVLTTNYTVSGGSDATGTVTMNVAPPSGYTLLIVRQTPIQQNNHFINNDINDATVQEQALDLLTMLVQETNNLTGRAISQPNSDVTAMTALPNAAGRAGKQCVFDANGNPQAVGAFGTWRATWATSTEYNLGDVIIDGAAGNNTSDVYTCLVNHISGTFSTDLAAGKWAKAIDAVALGAVAGANASASLYGSSTTSLTIGTGSQSLTVQASKNFNTGSPVFIVDSAATSNWMAGQVTSYDSTTGALVVNVTVTGGSGTIATWNVYVSGYTPNTQAANPTATIVGGAATNGSATTFMRSDAAPALALTKSSATLGSNVTIGTADVWTTAVGLTLGTGVWLVRARALISSASASNLVAGRLYDGTTQWDVSSDVTAATVQNIRAINLSAIVTNPPATLNLQGLVHSNTGTMLSSNSFATGETFISAVRIG